MSEMITIDVPKPKFSVGQSIQFNDDDPEVVTVIEFETIVRFIDSERMYFNGWKYRIEYKGGRQDMYPEALLIAATTMAEGGES